MRTTSGLLVAALGLLVSTAAIAQTTPTAPPANPTLPVIPRMPNEGAVFSRTPAPYRVARPDYFLPSLDDPRFANSRRYLTQYQQVQEYGRCAANISAGRSRHALAATPNTRTEIVELRQLTGNARGCLPYGYQAPIVFLRGGLAEALYSRLPANGAGHANAVTQQNASAFMAAETARSIARLPDDRAFTQLSNCLVLSAPAQVSDLIRSRHGSDEERAALNAIIGAAPACSDGSTFPVDGSRSFIRAYLAESAYRWATFQPAGRTPIG